MALSISQATSSLWSLQEGMLPNISPSRGFETPYITLILGPPSKIKTIVSRLLLQLQDYCGLCAMWFYDVAGPNNNNKKESGQIMHQVVTPRNAEERGSNIGETGV